MRRLRRMTWLLALLVAGPAMAAGPAMEMDLSGDGWSCWLDEQATWKDDRLHLPGVKLASLPVPEPTGGWGALAGPDAFAVAVPSTVEAYRWGHDGSPLGVEGNYQGVSWWTRTFTVPADWKGRRVLLRVASAVLRAEVLVNRKLVGYDMVGNTPFTMDITDAVRFGADNELAIRITDPFASRVEGVFDWQDYESKEWGSYRVPCSHGFGGVTGKVTLSAVPAAHVADVFVMNKPSPSAESPTDVDVRVELDNLSNKTVEGYRLTVEILPEDASAEPIWTGGADDLRVPPGGRTVTIPASCPEARLWDLDRPNLYRCRVRLSGPAGAHRREVGFGFRWFAPEGVGKDACLTLNGRRIVCRTAISWGFFPVSGTVPTHAMAQRQMNQARRLGLNMLSAHRTIAHPRLLAAADERGLLYYCEPGGYLSRKGDEFTHALAREKLLRMVRRDRNHPCVVWINMVNEPWFDKENAPSDYQLESMKIAHRIDPTRIITWGSGYGWNVKRGGSWMAPYEEDIRDDGYFDHHWHATGTSKPADVYTDLMYDGPDSYVGRKVPRKDIVFLGEENAVSSPPQLASLVDYYRRRGRMGWAGDDYLRWYNSFKAWLDTNDRNGAFDGVNDLCRSMGSVAYFRHAKVIETIRMFDIVDGYAINGWESQKVENYSGIVDIARHFKGDPNILAEANRPARLVVLPRTRVTRPGREIAFDVGAINELDLQGQATLRATVRHGNSQVESFQRDVELTGGRRYGQVLAEGLSFTPTRPGRYTIEAELDLPGRPALSGTDEAYIVDLPAVKLPSGGGVIDNSGKVTRFLASELNYAAVPFEELNGHVPFVIVGQADPDDELVDALVARVRSGMGLVILEPRADAWAKALAERKLCTFERRIDIMRGYEGGHMFALRHRLLTGLPQATGMDWPYQAVSSGRYHGKKGQQKFGLVMTCDEVAAGGYNQNDIDLCVTLGLIRHGRGRIVLSTLRILENLDSDRPPTVVPRRLLCNYLAEVTGSDTR